MMNIYVCHLKYKFFLQGTIDTTIHCPLCNNIALELNAYIQLYTDTRPKEIENSYNKFNILEIL